MKWLIFTATLALSSSLSAGPEPTTERTQELLKAFKQLSSIQNPKAKDYEPVDGFFDLEHLATAPATPHRSLFKDDEYVKFQALFKSILRKVAYRQASRSLSKAEIDIQPGKRPLESVVNAYVEEEDMDTEVVFAWSKVDQTLLIQDIRFDGASLVRDYQNQFGRIIKAKGVNALLKKLEAQLNKG